jgi:hypothetical protein
VGGLVGSGVELFGLGGCGDIRRLAAQ